MNVYSNLPLKNYFTTYTGHFNRVAIQANPTTNDDNEMEIEITDVTEQLPPEPPALTEEEIEAMARRALEEENRQRGAELREWVEKQEMENIENLKLIDFALEQGDTTILNMIPRYILDADPLIAVNVAIAEFDRKSKEVPSYDEQIRRLNQGIDTLFDFEYQSRTKDNSDLWELLEVPPKPTEDPNTLDRERLKWDAEDRFAQGIPRRTQKEMDELLRNMRLLEEKETQILTEDYNLLKVNPDAQTFDTKVEEDEKRTTTTATLEDLEDAGVQTDGQTLDEVVEQIKDIEDEEYKPTEEDLRQAELDEERNLNWEILMRKKEKAKALFLQKVGVQSRKILNSVKKTRDDLNIEKQLKATYARAKNDPFVPMEKRKRQVTDLINEPEHEKTLKLHVQIIKVEPYPGLIPKVLTYYEMKDLETGLGAPLSAIMGLSFHTNYRRLYAYNMTIAMTSLYTVGIPEKVYILPDSAKVVLMMGIKTIVYGICTEDEPGAVNVSDLKLILWIPLCNRVGKVENVMFLWWPGKTELFHMREGSKKYITINTQYNQRMSALTLEINKKISHSNFTQFYLDNAPPDAAFESKNPLVEQAMKILMIYFQSTGKHLIGRAPDEFLNKYKDSWREVMEWNWVKNEFSITANKEEEVKLYQTARKLMAATLRYYDYLGCLYDNKHCITRWNTKKIQKQDIPGLTDFDVQLDAQFIDKSGEGKVEAVLHNIRNFHNSFREKNRMIMADGDEGYVQYPYRSAVEWVTETMAIESLIVTNQSTPINKNLMKLSDEQIKRFNNIFFHFPFCFQQKKKKKKSKYTPESSDWLSKILRIFD